MVLSRLIALCSLLLIVGSGGVAAAAKFEPADGKVLVFVGQDNETIGGQAKYNDGYVDHFGTPAGITHYVYFTEGVENNFGFKFDVGHVDGLNTETTWGAGPMCMRCMLESPKLQGTVVHLSISMEFDDEIKVASGEYDHLIEELVAFVNEYSHVPFIIRIGYEFEGNWNHYEPEAFKKAWIRIVDALRAEGADNFATLLGSARRHIDIATIEKYYPGDDYVDWLGYSYWHGTPNHPHLLDFAKQKNKPVFIAETTPRGFNLGEQATTEPLIWWDWFDLLFTHMEQYPEQIKAVSYINTHWEPQPMWNKRAWGDARLQAAHPFIQEQWRKKMTEARYVHSVDGVYDVIGFKLGSE